MTASTSSGRPDPARRPGSPAQQRTGDRTLTIGFDELIKSSTLYAKLAASAHNFGGKTARRRRVADHSFPRDRLVPGRRIDRRSVS